MRKHTAVWIARTLALVMVAATFGAQAGISAEASVRSAARNAPIARRRATIQFRTVKGGLNDPAGFTIGTGGDIYFLERGTGLVRRWNVRTKTMRTFFSISRVDGSGERGALGIALSPNWPTNPYLYVYVTRKTTATSPLQNQLIRIKRFKGRGVGMRILFATPVSSATNHNGGRILFGPDKKLYVIIGENADPANSQSLNNLRGKILRVNAPGNASDGSPVVGNFHGRIWAYGIRNSFGFTFDSATGLLWETENGPSCNDEINLLKVGHNYGWGTNESCGSATPPLDTNNSGPKPRTMPKVFFRATLGLTGDVFCHGCGLGPAAEGRLFFGCVNDGILRSMALGTGRTNKLGSVAKVLTGPGGLIYSMETAPNGRIYFSNPTGIYRLIFA
jgi:glucose/arabinose dehydrogenase